MQRIYFEWKVSRKEKTKTTDFGTLNKGDGWVVTEADKHEPEPEQEGVMDERDNPNWDRPEWDSKYPKPKSYDKMTRGDVERYVFTCQNEERVAKRKAFQEAEAAEKAAKEAKEAADLAEYLRWDYPFPKPEFWDGMAEAAREAYIRKHTPQEA